MDTIELLETLREAIEAALLGAALGESRINLADLERLEKAHDAALSVRR